ncbi:MAG: hypothetical protein HC881_05285 [Leptolyngbyaceae cyanobacterium SL_7_1]|nr:hypothetical protein [Leptolyngbyaceae cyanobacterium SL_7_1]
MKREVVQDFLTLPGITGIALMDKRSRPYFYGVDRYLNFQQKEALTQGIQQVVETTPPGFEFYEFHFAGHQVYIYKLSCGVILLVLTEERLVYSSYCQAIAALKAEFQDDIHNPIATFRLLVGNIVPSTQPDSKPSGGGSTIPVLSELQQLNSPSFTTTVALEEILSALNKVSQFAIQYLGPTVVANYWKSTRPSTDWLSQFQIDRAARITVIPGTPSTQPLTDEQHQWIQDWTTQFVHRCSTVIRDFAQGIDQRVLSAPEKEILLSKTNICKESHG